MHQMAFKGAGKAGGTGGKFDQEDRSRDWYCPKCNERNFLKRAECFKCRSARPKDGGSGPPPLPANNTTMNGMVKSYNRKGFGFIMCLDGSPQCQDIYYSRENLHPSLQTRDIPGEHVTFEIQRFPDGKLVAKNVRPVGDSLHSFREQPPPSRGGSSAPIRMAPKGGRPDEEDRSRDWNSKSAVNVTLLSASSVSSARQSGPHRKLMIQLRQDARSRPMRELARSESSSWVVRARGLVPVQVPAAVLEVVAGRERKRRRRARGAPLLRRAPKAANPRRAAVAMEKQPMHPRHRRRPRPQRIPRWKRQRRKACRSC